MKDDHELQEHLKGLISYLNGFLRLNLYKFNYVTQLSDFRILLHNDSISPDPSKAIDGFVLDVELDKVLIDGFVLDVELDKVLKELGNSGVTTKRTYSTNSCQLEVRYVFGVTDNGILRAENSIPFPSEVLPPQKHRKMINEWIDSGGKRTVLQHEKARDTWIEDKRPTWLADEYKFADECVILMVEHYYDSKSDCIKIRLWPINEEDRETAYKNRRLVNNSTVFHATPIAGTLTLRINHVTISREKFIDLLENPPDQVVYYMKAFDDSFLTTN